MVILRVLARVIGVLWMLVLALIAIAISLYCLDGLIKLGSVRPDRLLHLSRASRHVGRVLAQLADPGATAGVALLCGLAAMSIGGLLLAGTLRSSRQRLAVLDADSGQGTVAARPRVLAEMSRYLAQQTEGVTRVRRPRLSRSRNGRRGRLKLRGTRTRTSDPEAVNSAVTAALAPVTEPFALRPRVTVRIADGRGRVQ